MQQDFKKRTDQEKGRFLPGKVGAWLTYKLVNECDNVTYSIAFYGIYIFKKVSLVKNLCHTQKMYFAEDIAFGFGRVYDTN